MLERIHWLGHASFRINGPPHSDRPVIFIHPWQLPPGLSRADLILISHDHPDHSSPEDVDRVYKHDTLVFGNQRVVDRLRHWPVQLLRPWQSGASKCRRVSVRALPAYTPDHAYHDKSYGGLGFLISVMRHDIYFAGDTGLIPEMEKIACDIALLPVGGALTMNYEEAASAAAIIQPRVAIPMHYGREVPGTRDCGRCFVQMVNSGVQARELEVENDRMYTSS